MASLKLEDGSILEDLEAIKKELATLKIVLECKRVGTAPELLTLLNKDALEPTEKELVLSELDHFFQELKNDKGYQTRDLIVLHPEIPGINDLLSKFERCHTHDDDEVRYVVAGEGVFGFVRPDGTQIELKVVAEDYINVPANTEHWFYMTSDKKIKAVRYFTGTDGWTPKYTDTPIRIGA